MALTSGSTQPEFSSFEPVATTSMVDPFTGSFTYNLPVMSIPGPNGAGYAVSLSNHAGSGMEEDASWVGYGWTLNPGAINRAKSGFPDDVQGGKITQQNNLPDNFTISTGYRIGLGFFSANTEKTTTIASANLGKSRTFNNYKGFSVATTGGISAFNIRKNAIIR